MKTNVEMIKEVLNKTDEGEQLIGIDQNVIKDGDFALSVQQIKYHNKDCYEFGLNAMRRDSGEPVDMDVWLIVNKKETDEMVDDLTDEEVCEFSALLTEALKTTVGENQDEVPAE